MGILRWVSICAMLVLAFIHPILIGTKYMHDLLQIEEPVDLSMFEHGPVAGLMLVSSCAFVVLFLQTIFTLCAVERPCGRFVRQCFFVAVFFVGACVPILCMAWLQLVSFCELYRGNTDGWVVTTRAQAKDKHAK